MIALWWTIGLSLAQSAPAPEDPPEPGTFDAGPAVKPPPIELPPVDPDTVAPGPAAPPPLPAEVRPESGGPFDILEITVWGTLAIQKAEDDIVDSMEELGYRSRRHDGRVVFRPPRAWMGAAIYEDGSLQFRRSVAGFQATPPETYAFDPRRQTTAVDPSGQPAITLQGGPSLWVLPSMRKVDSVRTKVRTALADELAWYHAVVARTALENTLTALPGRLDALWSDGVPLEGGPPIEGAAARRRNALEYWATRSDTPEGQIVAHGVAAWLDAVVQQSDHPITATERTEYEARRDDMLRLPADHRGDADGP